MPISRKPTIDYSKVKLYGQPDVNITTINFKKNIHSLRWTTNSWAHKYNGNIFKECEHGVGTYTWNRTVNKTVYEGKFYANNLHGYGRVSYDDGSIFEGLFKMNLRFGPGIYTYCNGEQDVGMWNASYLIRLSKIINPEWVSKLGTTILGKAKMLRYRKIVPIERNLQTKNHLTDCDQTFSLYSDCVRDVNSTFFNKPKFDDKFINKKVFYIDVIIPDNCTKIKVDDHGIHLLDNDSILKSRKTNKMEVNHLVAWNNNEFSIETLLFTFVNRDMESLTTPSIRKMLAGDRSAFRPPGILEQHSVVFLKYCSEGNAKALKHLIYKCHVHPDVCDAKGNSGIIYAASRDHHNVIQMLCTLGVNFNQFNDESLTALNISLLRYISKLNKITDWENAFILPLTCYPSKLDTGKLFECSSNQSETRIHIVNNPIDDQTSLHDKNISNILHWTKAADSQLLENYNYVNLKGQYDKFISGKRPCIFVFVPIVSVKRPYMEERSKKPEKSKRKPPRKPCHKNTTESKIETKTSKVFEGDNLITNDLLLNELQNKSLEDIEKTVFLLLAGGSSPERCNLPLATIFLGVVSLNVNIVELLLQYRADPNSRSPECIGFLTPLHFVVSLKLCRESLDIAELLLKKGAEPNLRASSNHWSILKADIHNSLISDDNLGMTPLHLLCIRHDLDADISGFSFTLAKLLLMNRANPDLLYMGHTALSLAMINGKKCMVKALLETRMVDPNQKLAIEIGVPLTLFLSLGYLEFLPIDVCISIMSLITEYGANPLNMVHEDVNALEFVRSNKSFSHTQNEIWPNRNINFKSNKCKKQYAQTKTTSTIESEFESKRLNYFYTLEKHLHELASSTMENYILGIVVRKIYSLIDKPFDGETLKYLKKLSKSIEIPNFEKTTEIFGKLADANINLDKDKVKATLEFTLSRDYVEADQLDNNIPGQESSQRSSFDTNKGQVSNTNRASNGSHLSSTSDTSRASQVSHVSYASHVSHTSHVSYVSHVSHASHASHVSNKSHPRGMRYLTDVGMSQRQKNQSPVDQTSYTSKHNLDKLVDYITELSKKDSKSKENSKFRKKFFYPEFDPATNKYNICFECHRRKDVQLHTCPICGIIKFCSRKCNIDNNARRTIHKCNTVFYDRLMPTGDRTEENQKLSPKKLELSNGDETSPIADKKNIFKQQNCEILGEAIDKYITFMLDIGGEIDFDKLIFPYCAYRDGNLYYRLFGEKCFIENYSLV